MTIGAVGVQELLLDVMSAVVDRSALTELAANLFSTAITNTIGSTTTGQFSGPKFGNLTDTSPSPGAPITSSVSISDMLNVFLFRPDTHVGAVIKALQTKNLLQILAEPNLIAVNGKEASFLAGGEFPFPVAQPSGQGLSTVTIQFREFGVRLKFTPVIQPNGNIHLRVVPEVSTLDFTNAVTVAGTTVPAISTRKADTEFEWQNGRRCVSA